MGNNSHSLDARQTDLSGKLRKTTTQNRHKKNKISNELNNDAMLNRITVEEAIEAPKKEMQEKKENKGNPEKRDRRRKRP